MKIINNYKTYIASLAVIIVSGLTFADVIATDQAVWILTALGGLMGMTFRHAIAKLQGDASEK
jgi:hypothetical protein